jgi:hypothetical protein
MILHCQQEVTKMQNRAAFWTLLSSSFLLALVATPATAGIDTWHFGTSFSVGGVHFRVGYTEAGPFGSSFYFEAAQPFSYRGHACSSYCHRRGPRYYHHPSCSAVHHHFLLHGQSPGYYLEHYAPLIAYPPTYYYGAPPSCCGTPSYYVGPPRWHSGYYGYHDRYRKPKYYGNRRPWHPNDRNDYSRDRYRQDQYRQDNRGRNHREQDYRDPKNRDRHNRGGIERREPDRDRDPPRR